MTRFCGAHAVALALCLSLVLVPIFAAEAFTTEFGKRKIPVDLIKRALQPHLHEIESIDLSRFVYEIVDGNLVGFETKLNLEHDTTLRPPKPSKSLKYTLNGNERLLTPSLTVRHGRGYTFLHRASDDRLMHVFGNGLNLKPLDAIYPDVFVNTLRTDPSGETSATDPVEVAKRIAVRNGITPTFLNSTVRQSGSCAAGTTHVLELAVAFDNQFCALHSNDEAIAATAVQTLVNQADEVFREFTCISIALVHIEAHCNDPTDPYTVLSDFSRAEPGQEPSIYIQQGFGQFWEQFRTDVRRDAAYFFSGFDDGTNIAGVAGVGATCNQFAYGWSERLTLTVFIHEIGHIVGSNHTPDGIMIATGFPGGDIFFSQASIDMISAYVDSTAEDCLSVSAPTSDVPALPPTPTSDTEIPQPTPVFVEPDTPVESDAPSATADPIGPRSDNLTCGGALKDSETFVCGSSIADKIEIAFSPKRKVDVMVRLIQRNGMFKATLSAGKEVKLRGLAARLSTDGRLGRDDIGPLVLYEDMPEMVTIEEDAFGMDLAVGANTCCGENLYLYVQLEVCEKKECVTRGLFKWETAIRCSDPCASSLDGTVVPFSATNDCPICLE